MEQIVFELQKISNGNWVYEQGGVFQGNNKSVWPVIDRAKPGRSPRSLRLGRFFGPRPPDRPARPPVRDPQAGHREPLARHREPRATAREPGTASPGATAAGT